MNKQIYNKGIALLSAIFPNLRIEPNVYWEFLKDLADVEYTKGVKHIIQNITELYPNTNIIALIRKSAKHKEIEYKTDTELEREYEKKCREKREEQNAKDKV